MERHEWPTSPADDMQEVAALAGTDDAGEHDMVAGKRVVHINLPAKAAAVLTVNLPNVSEAKNKQYSIRAIAAGGAGAKATVTDGTYSKDLTASGKYCVLYSDGFNWYEMAASA